MIRFGVPLVSIFRPISILRLHQYHLLIKLNYLQTTVRCFMLAHHTKYTSGLDLYRIHHYHLSSKLSFLLSIPTLSSLIKLCRLPILWNLSLNIFLFTNYLFLCWDINIGLFFTPSHWLVVLYTGRNLKKKKLKSNYPLGYLSKGIFIYPLAFSLIFRAGCKDSASFSAQENLELSISYLRIYIKTTVVWKVDLRVRAYIIQ